MSADVGALVALNGHIGGDGEISDLKSFVTTDKCQFDFAQCGLSGGGGKDVVVEEVGGTVILELLNG